MMSPDLCPLSIEIFQKGNAIFACHAEHFPHILRQGIGVSVFLLILWMRVKSGSILAQIHHYFRGSSN